MRAAAPRAGPHRAGLGAHRSPRRARSTISVSSAAFALPIMRTLAAWPAQATVGGMAGSLRRARAARARRGPIASCACSPTCGRWARSVRSTLDEAARVLADRLPASRAEPPARRYGRVFVASPAQLRGRSSRSSSSRRSPSGCFRRSRARIRCCSTRRASSWRRRRALPRLRPSAPSARSCSCGWPSAPLIALYVSFPTVEIGEGRPRVPSFYALEVWRAMTGRVPSADELQQAAARASQATLAWPAPADRDEAIDALEHDLATLRALVDEPDHRARGRAQYILQLNDCLQRSVRERFMRGKKAWSHWDGITAATDRRRGRSSRRSGSARAATRCRRCSSTPSARTSSCSSAIYRMRPAEDLEPLQRLDPLTRGSLFHAVQTAFYRQLQAEQRLPVTAGRPSIARSRCSTRRSRRRRRASTSCWRRRSIACGTTRSRAIRRDLRLWVDEIARAGGDGCRAGSSGRSAMQDGGALAVGRDPTSRPEPVVIDGRFQPARLDRSGRGARGDRRAARHRSQDRQVPRQGPHDRRRRRGAAAGALLAGARGGAPAGPSSRGGCTTRRPPAASATCRSR